MQPESVYFATNYQHEGPSQSLRYQDQRHQVSKIFFQFQKAVFIES